MTGASDGGPTPASFRVCLGACFRHECRLLFYAPLTYLFQAGFLVALSAATFLIAGFYNSDESSIASLLTLLPWVGLIFVPALAMRSWAEAADGTTSELTYSLPVAPLAVVLGKFLAGSLILLITLAFTATLPATAYYLGEPDGGVVLAGYLGLAALLATYYAVALFAAALGREQIGAFVLGTALLFMLLLLGWDVMVRLLQGSLSPSFLAMLAGYSPVQRLAQLGRGLLDFGSLAYFIVLTSGALGATVVLVATGRRGPATWRRRARSAGGIALGLAAATVIIPLLDRVPLAADLTAEREFTLHDGTLAVLERLPADIEVTLYWSAAEASVPTTIKNHARRVRDMLDELSARSGGKISIAQVDPQLDSDEELEAAQRRIRKVPMSSGDQFYLGAAFRHGERVGRIPYFDIRREGLLEYDIAVALNGLAKTHTPKVGILSPLLPNSAALADREGLSFTTELRQAYDLAVIPYFKDELPEDLDVLVVINATILKESMLYAIDQFVMGGGSLIVMMDPYLRADRPSNQVVPEPSEQINDISDLLLAYGARFLPDTVVGDAAAAAQVADTEQATLTYPYWLRLGAGNLPPGHAVTASLNEIFFVEPGAFAIEDDRRVRPLVVTGPRSGSRPRAEVMQGGPRQLAQEFRSDGRPRTLAVALSGPFGSPYREPPAGAVNDEHLTRSAGSGHIFAVADVDWVFDPFTLQPVEIGGETHVRPLNDNIGFLLNLVEYASGDDALISIRSRGRLHRPFTRVAALFAAAEAQHRSEESRLAGEIAALEGQAVALMRQSGVEDLGALPEALQDEVQRFQIELLEARKRLREIRRRSRQQVDQLGTRLTALNIVAGPLLVLLLWFLVAAYRRRVSRFSKVG